MAEIQGALHAFRPKKAPGLDGVSVELVKGIFKGCPAFILSLMNACLRVRGFPTSWKVSKLILLGKPGRDLSLPQSYRPICLLTVFSKLLDKLLTYRLTNLFYSKGLLNERQHGFRIGKSCETANNALWEDIQEALRCKGKVCLISLDVQGAFDTVWQQSVLYRLIAAQCPFNIFAMVRDYFQDRTVQYHFNNNCWSFPDTRGVPQGSCSGPFYWNIVLDTIFAVDLPTGCSVQAFADDLILLVRGETKRDIELKSGVALERLVSWAYKHKLQFNSDKTLLMPLTFGGRLTLVDPPQSVFKWAVTAMVADRFFSRNAQLHLRIYKGAIEPFILYGYGAWGNRIHLQKIRSTLNSIQRRPLLQLTGAYRTVSTVALQVVAGVLPFDLKAVEALAKFRVKVLRRDMEVGSRAFCSSNYLSKVHIFASHPSTWTVHPFLYTGPLGSDIEMFTDGSKMNGHVGCSVVVYYHGQLIHTEGHRLNDEASVYQAEISGFTLALSFVQRILYWDTVRIYTDSLSLLQALASAQTNDPAIWQLKATLREIKQNRAISLHWVKAHVGTAGNEMADLEAKHATTKAQPDQILLRPLSHINSELKAELLSQWQDRWILAINGRTTAEFFPQVALSPHFFNRRILQILTGHGRFPSYFHRFALMDHDLCECGQRGDVFHYLRNCPRTGDLRSKLVFDPLYPPSLFEHNSNLPILDQLVTRVCGMLPNV
ncbi:Putative protein in type-1 retrotransposable element R1DM [Araneus ventricosus]|uniref:Retrovirus-related Pol polyprotein from type-1 retrotransposable element R1 n=1 Tax=Araneus ventricosus TaxID=182803 RepID=A0A4Y2R4Z5_ARAVE|nr:Putative protein in type-1 retrotransposable element R1DM [Araneus ventricosus]